MKVKKINTKIVQTIQGAKNSKEIVKEINSFNIVFASHSKHTNTIFIQGDISVIDDIWKRETTIDWTDKDIAFNRISSIKGDFKNFFNNIKSVQVA